MKSMRERLLKMPYRIRINLGASDAKGETVIEFVPPDRHHIVSPSAEMVVVGDRSYMKRNGAWMQLPINMGEMLKQFQDPTFDAGVDLKISNVVSDGEEAVNGVAADVYEYDNQMTVEGQTFNSHVKLWLARDTGMPVKTESTSEVSGVKKTTTSFIEYPADLKIEAPIK